MSLLDTEDLTVMIEALDAWVARDDARNMMHSLVATIITSKTADSPEAVTETESLMAEKLKVADEDKVLRHDRAILIQAKLIQMRDTLLAENLTPAKPRPFEEG